MGLETVDLRIDSRSLLVSLFYGRRWPMLKAEFKLVKLLFNLFYFALSKSYLNESLASCVSTIFTLFLESGVKGAFVCFSDTPIYSRLVFLYVIKGNLEGSWVAYLDYRTIFTLLKFTVSATRLSFWLIISVLFCLFYCDFSLLVDFYLFFFGVLLSNFVLLGTIVIIFLTSFLPLFWRVFVFENLSFFCYFSTIGSDIRLSLFISVLTVWFKI